MGTRSTQVPKCDRVVKTPGDDIASLLCGAQKSALIVAPFMRSEALSRLLDSIPVGTETKIVTRWRPADLLAGASDFGVYDIAESKKVPLYLRHDLHAKFFAADDIASSDRLMSPSRHLAGEHLPTWNCSHPLLGPLITLSSSRKRCSLDRYVRLRNNVIVLRNCLRGSGNCLT